MMANKWDVKRALKKSGLTLDDNKENAQAGWYCAGNNSININKLCDIIDNYLEDD